MNVAAPVRYRAFISYSHRDGKLAQKLHRRLEGYSIPRSLRDTQLNGTAIGAKFGAAFRDRDELASAGSLSGSIESALDASAALIVVCSPAAVASPWVNAEIAYFRRKHPDRPALAFVVGGEPGTDPQRDPEHAAFPLQLLLEDVDDPQSRHGEPIAADAREQGDGFAQAFLKLVAGLLGLRYDQLRQRELRRRQRRWTAIAALSTILAAVFAALAVQATLARNQARAAQARAELELTSEQQTREFLLSVFHLADADEARGNSVTVREALDRAVARIDQTEFSRAEIRARFLATLGQAYSSLGLTKRAVELLHHSIDGFGAGKLAADTQAQVDDSRIELADLLYTMGEYDDALAQLEPVGAHVDALTWQQRARLANVRGDVLAYTEKDADARTAYQTALEAVDPAHAATREGVLARARSLSGLALLAQFAGDYAQAEQGYAQVVAFLQPTVGETHPDTIVSINSLGSAAYQNGRLDAARADWLLALAAAHKVYDPGAPQIATIENNLGRLMLETGDLAGAEPLLRDALASDRKHNSETFDDLAYPLYNLAYVRSARGDRAEAQKLLDEALPIAEKANHRMYGPTLTMLADLRCANGDLDQGAAFAERAAAVNQEHADIAPWYADQAALTRDYCRALAGTKTESNTKALVASLKKKWGEKSPFLQRAMEQLHAIEQRR